LIFFIYKVNSKWQEDVIVDVHHHPVQDPVLVQEHDPEAGHGRLIEETVRT